MPELFCIGRGTDFSSGVQVISVVTATGPSLMEAILCRGTCLLFRVRKPWRGIGLVSLNRAVFKHATLLHLHNDIGVCSSPLVGLKKWSELLSVAVSEVSGIPRSTDCGYFILGSLCLQVCVYSRLPIPMYLETRKFFYVQILQMIWEWKTETRKPFRV